MEFSHILLPVDFSEEARRVFPMALKLSKASGARITLLHVVPDVQVAPHGATFAPPLGSPAMAAETESARKQLEAHRGLLAGAAQVDAHVLVAIDPARAIADFAASHKCDLILTSTHGRTGFRHFMLGSVAEGILRRAAVPVMSIPRHA